MKISIITSLQLFLAAIAVAAPLTADSSGSSDVTNVKRQGLFHAGGEASGKASGGLGIGS
ncbi:uncharacterized protein ACHE_60302S [Aspergillus chevalieri]|uniref:Uncharacterized protein n=1 Tax=Aspergillus chevalieri TaxID=182096 RepID=A0A7R7VTB5_ASPCH|nr:uncharacterized protein ACHE_60302S [Aspergillus chevalieri]BCR90416.1 hypothetical protein ACHE_60302S [Aspergillus chevalieri]